MLAPLPRWSTTVLPRAARSSNWGSTTGDVFVRQAVEAVAAHARRRRAPAAARTSARRADSVRCIAVSKQATCGSSGARASSARIGARLWGRCSGASGTSFSSFGDDRRVDPRRAPRSRAPPWATRWPTAARRWSRGRVAPQPVDDVRERAVVAEPLARGPALARRRSGRRRPWRRSAARVQSALDLAAGDQRQLGALRREQRELDARRAGVQDEDRVGHRASLAALRRSPSRRPRAGPGRPAPPPRTTPGAPSPSRRGWSG